MEINGTLYFWSTDTIPFISMLKLVEPVHKNKDVKAVSVDQK
jgi:hypothetical protein